MSTFSLRERVIAHASLPAPETCRRIRESARISQAAIAAELGVSPQAISHWEQGRRRPSNEHVVPYVRVLAMLRDLVSVNDDDRADTRSLVPASAGRAELRCAREGKPSCPDRRRSRRCRGPCQEVVHLRRGVRPREVVRTTRIGTIVIGLVIWIAVGWPRPKSLIIQR